MSFVALHKLVSYLVAALGLLTLSLGPELDPTAEVVIVIGFVASYFAEGPRIRRPSWNRAWNVALLAFLGLEVARGFVGAPILPLVLEFTAALQISRLMNRRGAREHQQIGALALLHLTAATVLSTELEYAVAFLGFVVVAPWTLALGHLRAEIETQLGSRTDAERERSIERVLSSRRLVGAGFLAGTAALALPLFAMTGVVFVAFPRVGLGFLSFGRDTGQRVTGFGANVELGDFGLIRTDPTVVLRVIPPDMTSNPPDHVSIRMRGTSFDSYDGRRWQRGRHVESVGVGRIGSYYPAPRRMPLPSRDRRWMVILEPLDEPVLFLPPSTVGLEIAPRVTGGMEVGRQIEHAPGVDVRYGDADGLGLRYAAWTSDDPRDRVTTPLDPEALRRHLQVPEGHERVVALAREWAAGAADDTERVRALLARLRDSGEYTYSLQTPRVGDRVPLEVFLLEARSGHCEYFSTALAIQLRALGVPTRNVTGFLGGRLNRYGGYYAISQGDAHSWVEVWLPERGWVTVDPTPPSRGELAPDAGVLRGLREMLDALRTSWSEDVVSYDLRSQVDLFQRVRRWLGELDGPADAPARAQPAAPFVGPPSWAWALIGLLVLGGLGALVVHLRRRRRERPAEDPPHVRDALRLYRALEAVLSRLGHARPRERTPLEHLACLERAGFGEAELVREVTQRYLDSRFGGAPLDPADVARLSAALAGLRRRRGLSALAR